MSTTTVKKPSLSGPGLKKQGVVVLQTLFIFIFSWLEMWIRNGAGILTGLILCLVTYGGVSYVALAHDMYLPSLHHFPLQQQR
jgi:hypothetical protein